MNFDFNHARKETRPYACTFSSPVVELADGWQAPQDTLEAYGFSAIKLDHLLTSDRRLKRVAARLRGSKQLLQGFVAVTKSGRSIYSPVGATTMVLPADEPIAHLYLLVMGAPNKHAMLSWHGKAEQFPYEFKVTPSYGR